MKSDKKDGSEKLVMQEHKKITNSNTKKHGWNSDTKRWQYERKKNSDIQEHKKITQYDRFPSWKIDKNWSKVVDVTQIKLGQGKLISRTNK